MLSSFIPSDERIVTIEDAAELQLKQDHVVRLESRPSNIEGKGAVTIRDLVRNSLRMRPDRIVVGEVRDSSALDMLQAMNTGHDGSICTVHSNGPRDTCSRLETLVLMAGMDLPIRAIREQVASAVDLIVHQARLKDGSRRITHVTEVERMEGDIITLQDIFLFDNSAGFDADGKSLGHAQGDRPAAEVPGEDAAQQRDRGPAGVRHPGRFQVTVSRWRWVAASVLALAPVATVVSGAVLTPVSAADPAATESATIDHAQPTEDGVRLLVSVPGTGQVDLTGVQVRIGGDATTASAVTAAASSDVARTSILAIDTSDSMRGARIAAAKQAAKVYLSSVPANVEVGVLTFDDAVHLVVKPGLDRGAARAAVERLTLTRNTALYDGVLGALQAAGPGGEQAGQRKILVLSDGKDTTTTSLTSVTKAIKASGATVDVVSLQAGDEANQALGVMATTGKGTVLNATDATGLTAAFAGEADALARQIVVTAKVPDGKSTSANVDVSVPVAETTVTATAYLPVREAAAKPAASPGDTGPTPVSLGPLDRVARDGAGRCRRDGRRRSSA